MALPGRGQFGVQQTELDGSVAETTIVTAQAGQYADINLLLIGNTSATDEIVTIRDSTGGTIRAVVPVKAGYNVGFSLAGDSALKQAAVNNNWTAQCTNGVSKIEITAQYVKNPG